MSTNKGDNAFPTRTDVSFRPGMNKREYFAVMAMQAIASKKDKTVIETVSRAVEMADELIWELNRTTQ